jgi:peptidyl-prolyl cis-trans isomerase C
MQRIDMVERPGGGVIQVGEALIEESEIARETQHHPAGDLDRARRQAARALVIRQLLLQRAAQCGLDPTDEEACISALLEQDLQVPEPHPADCRRYYHNHPERFQTPPGWHLQHILLAAAPDDARARDRQYRLGQKLLRQLDASEHRFTELAQRYSDCPSRDQGGELGWLGPGQTVAELDRVLARLPTGLHGRPLASRYGWHLVHIRELRPARPLPYEHVNERVRHELLEQASRRALHQYLLALENDIGVRGFHLEEDS